MPRIDLDALPRSNATGYPAPFDAAVSGRWWARLAGPGGLTQMGASHVTLEPGAWSSQRHWHEGQDELLVMLAGEAVLVEDEGRTLLRSGDVCAWPAGAPNGHCLINESELPCTFVAISAGPERGGGYSDIDMAWDERGFVRKDGTPYPGARPASAKT
ncbi:cupin domain-containing protein [Novosphingobium mangrovi (ex Hu et al. 2023)]|uniref:Cupin domain-containing protein n=1 Tax=Novosphingobium mangrovi (ex Hu et al. 2023) TaxID=2930094 RepID=A0ABT0AFM1_9SPHN|nr:cupin domain-containing protein [Novosphingobium mangrovi (ex Hu et al. 2023)]MCJ1962011.1 cupin domain-containing protein [Novosphingobium mangrovi (ex Hu et al. 2023)]